MKSYFSGALVLVILISLILVSCQESNRINSIKDILNGDNPKISKVMKDLPSHEVQIIYSCIKHSPDGKITFEDEEFQVDDSMYFYPASTVKLPIALLALEKVGELDGISSETDMMIETDSIRTTIRQEIQKIFAISDNEAFNRLFEFIGKDEINKRLVAKGVGSVQINHRLSSPNSMDSISKAIGFFKGDSLLYQIDARPGSPALYHYMSGIKKGKGYFKDGILVEQPMDFSQKNYLPLRSLHDIMKRIHFPESYPLEKRFHIGNEDRDFLLEMMQKVPRELGYKENPYYDSYGKFFLYGDSKERIPSDIKIFNKVGYAYGTLTDCAYIENDKTGVAFLLTATILVNDNGIFNDDTYEYDEKGIPFLAELGRQVYELTESKIK